MFALKSQTKVDPSIMARPHALGRVNADVVSDCWPSGSQGLNLHEKSGHSYLKLFFVFEWQCVWIGGSRKPSRLRTCLLDTRGARPASAAGLTERFPARP